MAETTPDSPPDAYPELCFSVTLYGKCHTQNQSREPIFMEEVTCTLRRVLMWSSREHSCDSCHQETLFQNCTNLFLMTCLEKV